MSEKLRTRYRINRDWIDSRFWMVEKRTPFWPFWREVVGLLATKQEALDLIETIQKEYPA